MSSKMRMSRKELQKANKNLSEKNLKIVDDYMEEVAKIVNQFLGIVDKSKEVEEIFYQELEEVYKNTSMELYNIYPEAKEYKVADLFTITYDEDGKTIEERIAEYWYDGQEEYSNAQNSLERQHIKIHTIGKYYTLMKNETAIVETCIKKEKVQPIAEYLVIEGSACDCGGACDSYIGDWPADEDIPLPPYHPNCCCSWFYIDAETEEPDDIEIVVEE